MPDNRTPNDRIEGLDLLRVILSFWVIAIHVMHYGGLRTNSAVLQVIAVFIIASLIWLICFGLDLIRQRIFLLLRIDHLLDKLDAKLVAWHADT